MRRKGAIAVSIIFSILIAVHMLISFVMYVGLNPDIYRDAQISDDVASNAEINQETLDRATIGIINYMDGLRDNMNILSSEQEGHELFNKKEKAHMVDVKNLFVIGKKINMYIYMSLLIILVFYLSYDKEGMRKYFMKYSAITLSVILGLWLVIAIIAMVDFSSFWTTFHKIFFTNDLWLLDPSKDLLIRMMPQRFFVRIVVQILMRFLISYALVISVLVTGHVFINRKSNATKMKGGRNG